MLIQRQLHRYTDTNINADTDGQLDTTDDEHLNEDKVEDSDTNGGAEVDIDGDTDADADIDRKRSLNK